MIRVLLNNSIMATQEYPNPYESWKSQYLDYSSIYQTPTQEAPKRYIYPNPGTPTPAPSSQDQFTAWQDGSTNDYGRMNADIAANPINPQPAAQQSEDIMAQLMAPPPAPVKNQASQDRLQRIMKAKALGQGLAALGDIFSLSQGALVNRRNPDESISRYRNLFEQREDDYLRRMDDYNRQAFNQKIQALMYGQQLADRDEDREWRKSQAEQDKAFRESQAEQQQKNFDRQFDFNTDKAAQANALANLKYMTDAAYKNATLAQRNAYNQEKLAIDKTRAENAGSGSAQRYTIYDTKGTAIQLDPHERDKIFTMILDDKSIKVDADDMALLDPRLGMPVTTTAMNNIVQKYWQTSKVANNYVSGKYMGGSVQQPKTGNAYVDGLLGGTPYRPPYAPQPGQQTQQTKQTQPAGQNEKIIPYDNATILGKYQKQGYDISKQKPVDIAYDMAEKANIPVTQRPQWIGNKVKEIQSDLGKIDTSKTMQNIGYDNNAKQEIEVPSFFK